MGSLLLLAFQKLPAVAAPARTAVERDVQGYAIASCLTRQKEPLLKDQGYAWLDVIVQRSEGNIEDFKAVADSVEAQLAKRAHADGKAGKRSDARQGTARASVRRDH